MSKTGFDLKKKKLLSHTSWSLLQTMINEFSSQSQLIVFCYIINKTCFQDIGDVLINKFCVSVE